MCELKDYCNKSKIRNESVNFKQNIRKLNLIINKHAKSYNGFMTTKKLPLTYNPSSRTRSCIKYNHRVALYIVRIILIKTVLDPKRKIIKLIYIMLLLYECYFIPNIIIFCTNIMWPFANAHYIK